MTNKKTTRIRWYNIIPKSIQRLQAKYFSIRDHYIETDYHYNLDQQEQKEQQQPTNKKTLQVLLILIALTFIFNVFLFISTLLI